MEGDATHTAPLLGFCDLSLLPIPSSGAMASLEDRVFFITGTTSGIGEFTAGLLAKEIGWQVEVDILKCLLLAKECQNVEGIKMKCAV